MLNFRIVKSSRNDGNYLKYLLLSANKNNLYRIEIFVNIPFVCKI